MMTGPPASNALGPPSGFPALNAFGKPLTIRHCRHIQNTRDCGCLTGNLLATISRARREIPAVGKRQTASLSGASSHAGAESGVSPTDLQWNGPLMFRRRD